MTRCEALISLRLALTRRLMIRLLAPESNKGGGTRV